MAIRTYSEFWPFYLEQHSDPLTRSIHYLGTGSFLVLLAAAAIWLNPWLVPAAFAMFYLPAWVAHFVIEGNRPATWTYPVWSFVSDIRMFFLWLTGRLNPKLRRAR